MDAVGPTLFGLPAAAIGPITAAIVAGAISLVGLIITKEQKTSEFRQSWINDLRCDVAEFLSHVNALRDINRLNKEPEAHWALAGSSLSTANQCFFRIRLRLNPRERKSLAILATIEEIGGQFSFGVEPNEGRLRALETTLISQTNEVLKEEWDRVRRGESAFVWAKRGTGGMVAVMAAAILIRLLS